MGLFSRRRSAPPPSADDPLAPLHAAAAANPDNAEAHFALGNALREHGDLAAAIASYARAAELRPDLAATHFNLANAQRLAGMIEPAIAAYGRAIERAPQFADAHHYLGIALFDAGRFAEAAQCQRRAVELAPGLADAWLALANAQTGSGALGAAVASHLRAIELDPARAVAHHDLGTTLYKLGRIDEAILHFRRALELDPKFADAWTGLLFCASHSTAFDRQSLYEEHLRFGSAFDRSPARSDHRRDRDPRRKLRVGLVSPDFREHAAALFFEPLLAALANRASLSLHAYSNHAAEDAGTHRMTAHVARFTPVASLSDDALAQMIEDDGIDILVDLAGHTAGNRLPVFARKPAPVQASWIGYLGTTGLRAMDYYLADAKLFPDDAWQECFAEKIVRLPAWAAFVPASDLPVTNPLPALANGHLTFASFNRMSKLGPSVVALWSRVLRELPLSRLLLAGMPGGGEYDRLVGQFAGEGISHKRLALHPRCDTRTYLMLHQRVDIVLDAFPYTGGNTTTHALSMGVPVLTLAGSTPPSRQGAAIMAHVGLPDFVAPSADDFVAKAVRWSRDLDALATVRRTLRARCISSAMANPAQTADAVEAALRTMWRRWCAGEAPAAFTVD